MIYHMKVHMVNYNFGQKNFKIQNSYFAYLWTNEPQNGYSAGGGWLKIDDVRHLQSAPCVVKLKVIFDLFCSFCFQDDLLIDWFVKYFFPRCCPNLMTISAEISQNKVNFPVTFYLWNHDFNSSTSFYHAQFHLFLKYILEVYHIIIVTFL